MSTYREFVFECSNKDCPLSGKRRKVYAWSDRENDPDCDCGERLMLVDEIISAAPAYLRFDGLPDGEKRAILKKRSQDHFNNKMKEEWIEKNRV